MPAILGYPSCSGRASSLGLFSMAWGADILGPFPIAPGQVFFYNSKHNLSYDLP